MMPLKNGCGILFLIQTVLCVISRSTLSTIEVSEMVQNASTKPVMDESPSSTQNPIPTLYGNSSSKKISKEERTSLYTTNMSKKRRMKRKGSKLTKKYQFGHRLNPYFSRIVAVYLVIVIVVAVVCNTILISAIICVRNLHSFVHFLPINMAVGDIITAIGTVPFDVEFFLRGSFSRGLIACGIMQTVFLISLPSSVLCLTLITAERFITIVFSLQEIITKQRVIVSLIVMWIYTLLTATFPLMYQSDAVRVEHGYCWLKFPIGYQIFQVTANFVIPIVFILGAYTKLFMISCAHANKTARTISTIGTMLLDPIAGLDATENPKKIKKPGKLSCSSMFYRNLKASKRIALLVGVFLICWLPFIILSAVNYVCECLAREVTWFANAINYSSVAINPLLYGLLNKQIRKEVLRRVKRARLNYFSQHSFSRSGIEQSTSTRQPCRNHCTGVEDKRDGEIDESRKLTETDFSKDEKKTERPSL